MLESLRAKGEGTSLGKALDAKMQVVVSGLHPRPAAGYLQPLGLKPVGRDLAMTFNARLTTAAATRPSSLAASVKLDGISVIADGQEAAALDTLSLDATSISPTFADIARLVIDGAQCAAEHTAAGGVRIAGLELVPVAAVKNAELSAASATTQPTLPPYLWSVAEIAVRHARAAVVDRAVVPAADLALSCFIRYAMLWAP